ncbi:unnamed protein product [Nyctereutes procyonoides]|uniref:(raccoon dog) hypothetical protein n=1 Tax=Nyctereutes procyonoides TaxID=34880 RepID=A0A811YVZ0_NYCPR|nr:unnamed protein product [Nyctereutes procyonoides]
MERSRTCSGSRKGVAFRCALTRFQPQWWTPRVPEHPGGAPRAELLGQSRALRGEGMPGSPEDPQPPSSSGTGRVQHPRLRSRWCHHQGESCSALCIGPRRYTAPGAQMACPMGSLVVSGIRVLGRAVLLHCGASALPGVSAACPQGRTPPPPHQTQAPTSPLAHGAHDRPPCSDSGGKETILTPTRCMAVTIHAAVNKSEPTGRLPAALFTRRPRDPWNMVLRGQHCSLFLLQSLGIGRTQACPTFCNKSKDA